MPHYKVMLVRRLELDIYAEDMEEAERSALADADDVDWHAWDPTIESARAVVDAPEG